MEKQERYRERKRYTERKRYRKREDMEDKKYSGWKRCREDIEKDAKSEKE